VDIATDHRWWSRIKPLDVTGYMASIEDCRQRFPRGCGILSWGGGRRVRTCSAREGAAGAIVRGHGFERILGSPARRSPTTGASSRPTPLFGPDVKRRRAMRYYFAELVRADRGAADLFEVLAHPGLPAPLLAPGGAHLYRERAI